MAVPYFRLELGYRLRVISGMVNFLGSSQLYTDDDSLL